MSGRGFVQRGRYPCTIISNGVEYIDMYLITNTSKCKKYLNTYILESISNNFHFQHILLYR